MTRQMIREFRVGLNIWKIESQQNCMNNYRLAAKKEHNVEKKPSDIHDHSKNNNSLQCLKGCRVKIAFAIFARKQWTVAPPRAHIDARV